jgi:hypothetical protein
MSLNFPDAPSINDEYSAEGRTWTWDGTAWLANETIVSIVSAASPITFIGNQIAIDQNALVIDGGTSAAPQSSINLRRSTAAQWVADSSILASGEPGFESDTNKLKLGDGVSTWTALSYSSGGGGVEISSTAPTDTEATPLWWDTDKGKLYIYYDGFWVEAVTGIVGPAGATGATGPTGASGADGPSGVIAATYPVTYNAGTQTVGIDLSDYTPKTSTVSDKTSAYTLALGDKSNLITASGTFTITIPSATFSAGDRVDFVNIGTGVITFAGAGVTVNSIDGKKKIDLQFNGATFFFTSASAGVLIGALAT